jgi:hypothetical protein
MNHLDPRMKPGVKFRIWCCDKEKEKRICTMTGISVNGFVTYTYDEDSRCVPAEDSDWPSHCVPLTE